MARCESYLGSSGECAGYVWGAPWRETGGREKGFFWGSLGVKEGGGAVERGWGTEVSY